MSEIEVAGQKRQAFSPNIICDYGISCATQSNGADMKRVMSIHGKQTLE
jgi:hypothetical protein